jgi:hypothetical protein
MKNYQKYSIKIKSKTKLHATLRAPKRLRNRVQVSARAIFVSLKLRPIGLQKYQDVPCFTDDTCDFNSRPGLRSARACHIIFFGAVLAASSKRPT